MRLKRCRGACGEEWPVESFSRDPGNSDGRRNECNACRQERRAELGLGAARKRPWQRKFERGYDYSTERERRRGEAAARRRLGDRSGG